MGIVVTVVHVIVCIFLMLTVLLQSGKGGGMGSAFGGGSSTGSVFGGSGAGNFLRSLTGGAAAVFMLTSILMAYLASSTGKDYFDRVIPQQRAAAEQRAKADADAKAAADAAEKANAPATESDASSSDTTDAAAAPAEGVDAGEAKVDAAVDAVKDAATEAVKEIPAVDVPGGQ